LEETDCSLAIKARERKVTSGLKGGKTGETTGPEKKETKERKTGETEGN